MGDDGLGHDVTRGEFVALVGAPTIFSLGVPASASAADAPATASVAPNSASENDVVNVSLNVNGTERRLALDPRVTLLDAVRDHLGLTGTKKGCDQGTCGACTVLVNGRRIVSCLTLAAMHEGDRVTTIEGLAQSGTLHPVQAAFVKYDGFQCGYCTSGQIVSAVGMLGEGRPATREAIRERMSGNICRCGCYPHIVDAVAEAGGIA